MSSFTRNLSYKYLDNGLAEITQPVRFYFDGYSYGNYIELPAGTLTNFASIPKFIQWVFPVDHEDYKMAAAFHDFMVVEFENGAVPWIRNNSGSRLFIPTWQEAANIFREMIKVRQTVRRNKRNKWKKVLGAIPDLITRWAFWTVVSIYGLFR